LIRRFAWLAYSILLYYTGLSFTTWLLEPALFQGGLDWLAVMAFPFVLPGFFVLGRRLGCGWSGCSSARCDAPSTSNRSGQGGAGPMRGP